MIIKLSFETLRLDLLQHEPPVHAFDLQYT